MQLQSPDPRNDRLTGPIPPERRGWQRLLLVLGLVVLLFLGAGGAAVYTGLVSLSQLRDVLVAVLPAEAPTPPLEVAAQEAGQPPVPAPASERPAAQLPAQVPAQAAQAPDAAAPSIVRQEDFGDWHYSCVVPAPGAAASCSIVQQLAEADSRAILFIWRIVADASGGLVGIWQTPESVLLTRGLTLEAGTPQPITIPFETCGSGRCQAVANLAPDFVATLSTTEALSVTFTLAASRQSLTLPLSPDGLAEGLAALGVQ